jgi:hypothetical protein
MSPLSHDSSVQLQYASIDLLLDLASQPSILSSIEASPEIHALTDSMVARLHMQENNMINLHVTLHYLTAFVTLSHRMRRTLVKRFPVLSESLLVILHPIPAIAVAATSFFVTFVGDDKAIVDSLVDHSISASVFTAEVGQYDVDGSIIIYRSMISMIYL